ncbi:MAG TPA: metallophosphoesterase [Gemmataceae bacterium]|nr:metallophosphoesterase [Gemmataceae bacterium]
MTSPFTSAPIEPTTALPDCVELGVWTKIPDPPPYSLRLKLNEVAKKESRAIKERGAMTFHTVGCTGCHADQQATIRVATTMAVQGKHPQRFGGTQAAVMASFLYHLGDVVYKHDKDTAGEQSPLPLQETQHDFAQLYNAQFYAPYASYAAPIFAVAGNHDGKNRDPDGPFRKSAIHHFLKNFCGSEDGGPPDNQCSARPAMTQPYPYWLFQTPLAYFIGLYTNVNNAGQLDNPEEEDQPQYRWLVQTLRDIKAAKEKRAVFVAVHYPPYSAAVNFLQRGDPNLGPTPRPWGKSLEPLGMLLQQAFRASGQFPDAVFSAHAHHYQRLTYTHANGRQIPYLIAGGGGHAPVEKLSRPCLKKDQTASRTAGPAAVVFPPLLKLPPGDRVDLAAFNDTDHGFLRITLDHNKHRLTGEYFTAYPSASTPATLPALNDSFTLDLRSHTVS